MSTPDPLMLSILTRKPKPEPERHQIRFDVPPITPADIVSNVFHGTGGWKTLQQVANETAEAERQRKLDEQYGRVPIPEPEF